ncbi:hypothetical protein [Nitriliruptor alkaliphilus]|uniref:hypothetical protein n=1 Tax=Nitriliruptor alkaliphilus TaxID=427918 RepID=UPI00069678B8|nr:hypothetical protein [Nitriliruptor alkaliphilus]
MAERDVEVLSIPGLIQRERLRVRPLRRHRVAMRLLPERLKLRVLTAPTPDAKDAAAFAMDHPDHRDAVIRAGDLVSEPDQREIAVPLLFESWSEYGFAERVRRPGDQVLFHEAILQRTAFLMAVVPPASGAVTDLLDSLPPPDGVVLLDLPLELAIDRVVTRGREFLMTEVMASMSQQIDAIVGRLRSRGVPVAVVRADRPPNQSLPEVNEFLREQLRRADRQGRTPPNDASLGAARPNMNELS